jgi:hypothetical protein
MNCPPHRDAPMPRRGASFTQADIARRIRAAKQAGAERVDVHTDGTISVVLKDMPPPAPANANEPASEKEIIL